MVRAGVRNVKDNLSDYLRRIQHGERVVITSRGQPVAAIVGFGEQEGSEVGWNLVRQGGGEWAGGKPRGLADAPRVPGRRAEEIVLEDRR